MIAASAELNTAEIVTVSGAPSGMFEVVFFVTVAGTAFTTVPAELRNAIVLEALVRTKSPPRGVVLIANVAVIVVVVAGSFLTAVNVGVPLSANIAD